MNDSNNKNYGNRRPVRNQGSHLNPMFKGNDRQNQQYRKKDSHHQRNQSRGMDQDQFTAIIHTLDAIAESQSRIAEWMEKQGNIQERQTDALEKIAEALDALKDVGPILKDLTIHIEDDDENGLHVMEDVDEYEEAPITDYKTMLDEAVGLPTTSATEFVIGIISESEEGIGIPALEELTGFKPKKIYNIIHTALKKDLIRRVGRGVYAGA